MKLAFMSSVCPQMTLGELISTGKRHGYEGIEFRPQCQQKHGIELQPAAADRKAAARLLSESGLEGCCLSPGVWFCKEEAGARDEELEKLFGYIDLAAEVCIGRIRVFGDPLPNTGSARRSANYEAQADYLGRASQRAGQAHIRLVLETHGTFRAFDAGEVMYRAGYPAALWINWHLSHCLRHGEDVDEAYRHVKGRVAHVHFSLLEEEGEQCHVQRQVELLRDDGFDGFFSLEVINPEDPEAVLARHVDAWKTLRKELDF